MSETQLFELFQVIHENRKVIRNDPEAAELVIQTTQALTNFTIRTLDEMTETERTILEQKMDKLNVLMKLADKNKTLLSENARVRDMFVVAMDEIAKE